MYSYWDGKKLGYIEARKVIYAPLYSQAVECTTTFQQLKALYDSGHDLWLRDFDGYDFSAYDMTYENVINNASKKMGHAFVLAMMLEGKMIWKQQQI